MGLKGSFGRFAMNKAVGKRLQTDIYTIGFALIINSLMTKRFDN
jgi:hypothetical protein